MASTVCVPWKKKKVSPVSSTFIILCARGAAVQLPFFSLEVYFFRVCGRNLQGWSWTESNPGRNKVNTNTHTHTHRRQNETACLGVLVEECVSPISYAYSFTPNSTVTSCRNYGALSDLTYQHTCTHRERIPQLVRGRCGIGGSASILRSGGGEEQFVQRREGALSSGVLVMCETHVQCRDSDGFCARAEKKVKAAEQDPTKKRKKGGIGGAN